MNVTLDLARPQVDPITVEVIGSALSSIVEEMGAVTVVPPGWRLEVGRLGELNLLR